MALFGFPLNLVLIVCSIWAPALSEAANASLTDGEQTRRCYACTSIDEENSQCEMDPAAVPSGILDPCHREVCTIVRVEEWPSRRVKSFYRGCDERTKMFERNHCQVEKNERTCFTACVGDLCNSGNGEDDSRPSSLSSTSSGCVAVPTLVTAFLLGWTLSAFSGARP